MSLSALRVTSWLHDEANEVVSRGPSFGGMCTEENEAAASDHLEIHSMSMRYATALLTIAALLVLPGCASRQAQAPRLSEIRPPDPQRREVRVEVPRARLQQAARSGGGVESLRIVEVYRRNQEFMPLPPEYRLFNIERGSIADLLGLKNADVVVAANDYVIPNPNTFRQYLLLLPAERDAQIEVRRGRESILFRYEFTG